MGGSGPPPGDTNWIKRSKLAAERIFTLVHRKIAIPVLVQILGGCAVKAILFAPHRLRLRLGSAAPTRLQYARSGRRDEETSYFAQKFDGNLRICAISGYKFSEDGIVPPQLVQMKGLTAQASGYLRRRGKGRAGEGPLSLLERLAYRTAHFCRSQLLHRQPSLPKTPCRRIAVALRVRQLPATVESACVAGSMVRPSMIVLLFGPEPRVGRFACVFQCACMATKLRKKTLRLG